MHFYRLFTAFVLSLLAMAVVPLCYSLTIIDRHNPNDRVRIEINDGTDPQGVSQWQLSLLLPPPPPWGGGGRPSGLFEIDLVILKPVINWLIYIGKDSISFEEQPSPAHLKVSRVNADGSPTEAAINVGWLDFLNIEQLTDVNFWNNLFQRAATSCPAGDSHQWQLGCLKLFFERTALKTNHSGGLKAVNGGGEPSGKVPDKAPEDENNAHQKEKKDQPEDQQNHSSGENNYGREEGDNRKDDNGKESKKNTRTQDLQVIANQLVALIESDDPDAVFKLRQILEELDMPQRLQVLEIKSTNTGKNAFTPLEAILELQRSFYENSTRNRFIEQLIEATSDQTRTLDNLNIPSERQPMIPPDRSIPEAGDNNLMILFKIVQDIINRFNQSDLQPSIGHFEKSCFTEYFVQLLLLYSNPLESIRELLGKISDSVIKHDIMISAQSLTFSTPFRAILIQLDQHPSFHELERLSNELIRQVLTSQLLQEPSVLLPLTEPVASNCDNTSNSSSTNNSNRFTHYTRQVNRYRSDSGSSVSSPVLPADRYLQQGARPKLPDPADRQNPSSQKRFQTGRSYGNHHTNGAHNRSDLEASGINQNFSTQHSTDDSLLVELKGRAQEKKEKKRQQTKELTEEAQKLRIEKQSLTAEVQALRTVIQELTEEIQGLRLENQELVATNKNLVTKDQELYKCMVKANTEALHLKEQIKKLHVDLRRQQELVDHLIHRADNQTASANLLHQMFQANSLAVRSNGTAFFVPFHPNNNEKANPPKEQLKTSAQEKRKPLCRDYRRLCYVKFECCQWYFPCHRCHNESDRCEVTSRIALHATRLLCSVCGFNGEITENSQTCPNCNEQMSQYFCAKCKHFTDMEKKPYHCDKCGICRVEEDKNFHCDTCNVCLDTGLQNNHKCQENLGQNLCCICLEDTFTSSIRLNCSHIIHYECGIAMIHNGIRTCPVCRHSLYDPPVENNH